MKIEDHQRGWRESILTGNGERMAERSRMGVEEEVEEDKHRRRAEGKRNRDGEMSRETDKPNEVETTSVQLGEGTRSRRVLNRLDKELRRDILIFSFTV